MRIKKLEIEMGNISEKKLKKVSGQLISKTRIIRTPAFLRLRGRQVPASLRFLTG